MIIRSLRHGYLTAMNGVDNVAAEYERGLKLQDGYHPHWNIMLNGHVLEPVYGGRTDVEAMMERLLVLPSPTPMDVGQTNAMFSATGMVRGILCIPLKDLMTLSTEENLASLNRLLTPVRLQNIQCHAVGSSEDGKSVYIRISGVPCPLRESYTPRILTSNEWDCFANMLGYDDSKIHWESILSWCETITKVFHRAACGCTAARRHCSILCNYRLGFIGFRPVLEFPQDNLNPAAKDGDTVIAGTLYMGGKPVRVPQNPTKDGDIEDYIPGASLEVREPLTDPDYQIQAIRVGNTLVADRNILKNISWDDLHQQGFC